MRAFSFGPISRKGSERKSINTKLHTKKWISKNNEMKLIFHIIQYKNIFKKVCWFVFFTFGYEHFPYCLSFVVKYVGFFYLKLFLHFTFDSNQIDFRKKNKMRILCAISRPNKNLTTQTVTLVQFLNKEW